MAAPEDTLADMIEMLKDIKIKEDVQELLGPKGKDFQTWGEVNNYMLKTAMSLNPNIVKIVKNKLIEEYSEQKDLIRALKYDLILISNRGTANDVVRREAQVDTIPQVQVKSYRNNALAPRKLVENSQQAGPMDDPDDLEFFLHIAMLLKGVKAQNMHIVADMIVSMAAARNGEVASEGDASDNTEVQGSPAGKNAVNNSFKRQQAALSGSIVHKTTKVSAPFPGPPPLRDYRTAQGTDAGAAMREQLLRSPSNGCNQS